MEIYQWMLDLINPRIIDLEDLSQAGHGLILQNSYIVLNRKDNEKEQVTALLHEMLHLHPHFISYTGGLWAGTIQRDENIESEIEKNAQRLYNERRDLVEIMRLKLEEAKKITLSNHSNQEE